MYGLANRQPLMQQLGHIHATEGLCVAFPNIFQHQTTPFSLLDRSKSGHLSMLVFISSTPPST